MIKDELNKLIHDSMLNHDSVRTETFRAIKTAIMNWETAKENIGKIFGEVEEIAILRKLAAQYEDTATMCNDGKHDELVANATASADIIKSFLPAPVTENDILTAFDDVCAVNGYEAVKKNMGNIIKGIKALLPGADGKMVAQIVGRELA